MATTAQHERISEQFLEHAEAEFENGDLLQASEKAWGAVAHYVKSVAKERGMREGAHWHINAAADEILKFADDPEVSTGWFNSMNGLHRNFYEADMTEHQVRVGLNNARALLDQLKSAARRMPSRRSGA